MLSLVIYTQTVNESNWNSYPWPELDYLETLPCNRQSVDDILNA